MKRKLCLAVCLEFGVFATKDFQQGDFLLDYHGNLLDPVEADGLIDEKYVYDFSICGTDYRCGYF